MYIYTVDCWTSWPSNLWFIVVYCTTVNTKYIGCTSQIYWIVNKRPFWIFTRPFYPFTCCWGKKKDWFSNLDISNNMWCLELEVVRCPGVRWVIIWKCHLCKNCWVFEGVLPSPLFFQNPHHPTIIFGNDPCCCMHAHILFAYCA